MTSQLERLAKPFPQRLIHENPSGGGSYVKHSVVTEKLLAVVGPFDFELVEVVRGHVDGAAPNPNAKSVRGKSGAAPLDGAVVGAVCRLSVVVDGRRVSIEEVGDCESPHNWPHDGARLKDAMSDALKRCAMRLGVTLHLWSGPEFSLYDQIKSESAEGAEAAPVSLQRTSASGTAPSAPSPAVDVREHPAAANGGDVSSSPPTSKAAVESLKARALAVNDSPRVKKAAADWNLPGLNQCNPKQLEMWGEMLREIEVEMEAPFVKANA